MFRFGHREYCGERVGRMTHRRHHVAVAYVETAHHRGIHERGHVGRGHRERTEDVRRRPCSHGLREFAYDAHGFHVERGEAYREGAEDACLGGFDRLGAQVFVAQVRCEFNQLASGNIHVSICF